jgi:2-oxoglutarate dehydrogenase E2 component (dihydrolipoamide succinyltransferase)
MATEFKLPDLGDGITDVTISRWRVPVGATVKAGEIILEVATDKVDTEVAAPADGTLLQVNFGEGALAPVTAVIALIGAAGESVQAAAPAAPVTAPAPAVAAAAPAAAVAEDVKASPVAKRVAEDKGVALGDVKGSGPGGQVMKNDVLAAAEKGAAPAAVALTGELAEVASLIVRRTAADLSVNLAEIAGGRPLSSLTKYDVLSAVASREAGKEVKVTPSFPAGAPTPAAPATVATPAPAVPAPATAPKPAAPAAVPGALKAGEELIKHSRMRAAIAKNTSASLFSAPHVTTMWEIDMSAALAHRAAKKKEFAAAGVNLTLTAYFIEAIVAGLRAIPAANATWTDEGVILKRYFNIGMATALPVDKNGMGGLIVPVIKNAGELNLLGLARAVNELADRARKNELRADDLADGTFTISNYGTSGSKFQTPVIVQPQVGILGVGAVEKRAIVVSNGHPLEANTGDYLTFRPMTTLGFSYDHRVLDGATADGFCAAVKKQLESYSV